MWSSNRSLYKAHTGQNLVELLLVFPFFILLAYACLEISRAWQTYNGAKMAALDAVYTASVYHDTGLGSSQLDARLNEAKLDKVSSSVTAINNNSSYQVAVSVKYTPLFAGISIPTLSGDIPILPTAFNIDYTAVRNPAVY